jgi:hypothetical protein
MMTTAATMMMLASQKPSFLPGRKSIDIREMLVLKDEWKRPQSRDAARLVVQPDEEDPGEEQDERLNDEERQRRSNLGRAPPLCSPLPTRASERGPGNVRSDSPLALTGCPNRTAGRWSGNKDLSPAVGHRRSRHCPSSPPASIRNTGAPITASEQLATSTRNCRMQNYLCRVGPSENAVGRSLGALSSARYVPKSGGAEPGRVLLPSERGRPWRSSGSPRVVHPPT